MRRIYVLLLILTALAYFSPNAQAATYYVATNGNDASAGTSISPWATLQHAVETIAVGDVIIVKAGTYAGCRIRNSGQAGAPIRPVHRMGIPA